MRGASSALLCACALVLRGAAQSTCPPAGFARLSVDDVQDLLAIWNLAEALGDEFVQQKVDGFKLKVMTQQGSVDMSKYPNAQPFDWMALRQHISACEGVPTAPTRRQLGATTAHSVGLHIKKDAGLYNRYFCVLSRWLPHFSSSRA